jgi:hypothetical protein
MNRQKWHNSTLVFSMSFFLVPAASSPEDVLDTGLYLFHSRTGSLTSPLPPPSATFEYLPCTMVMRRLRLVSRVLWTEIRFPEPSVGLGEMVW